MRILRNMPLGTRKILFRLFIVAVSLALAWFLSSLVIYIIIAALIALVMQPLVDVIGRLKLGRFQLPLILDVALAMIMVYGLLGVLLALLIPVFLDQATALTNLEPSKIEASLQEPMQQLARRLHHLGIKIQPQVALRAYFDKELVYLFNIDQITDSISTIVGFTSSALIGFFAVSFITFNFLREPDLIKQVIIVFTPRANAKQVLNVLSQCGFLLRRYFLGLLIQFTLVSLLLTMGLSLISLPNAFLVGFLSGVFNLIPYLGPVLGIGFALLMGLTSNLQADFTTHTLPLLGNILIVYGCVNAFDAFLNVPLIYSRTVRAHPLEIFLVILMSSKIAGIPGMILAIPTYTVIRVILRQFFNQYEAVRRLTRNL
jgi:predicted PurR-regulated permease PerM